MDRRHIDLGTLWLCTFLICLPGLAAAQQFPRSPATAPRTRAVPQARPGGNGPAVAARRSAYRVNMKGGKYVGRIDSVSADQTYITVTLVPTGRVVAIKLRLRNLVNMPERKTVRATTLVGKYVLFDVHIEEYFKHYQDIDRTQVAYLDRLHREYSSSPLLDKVSNYLHKDAGFSDLEAEQLAGGVITELSQLSAGEWLSIAQASPNSRVEGDVRSRLSTVRIHFDYAVFDNFTPDPQFGFDKQRSKHGMLIAGGGLEEKLARLTLTLPADVGHSALIGFFKEGDQTKQLDNLPESQRFFDLDQLIKLQRVEFVEGKATCHIVAGHYRMVIVPQGHERAWVDVEIKPKESRTLALPEFAPQTYVVARTLDIQQHNEGFQRERFTIFSTEPLSRSYRDENYTQFRAPPNVVPKLYRNDRGDLYLNWYTNGDKFADLGPGKLEDFADAKAKAPVWKRDDELHVLSGAATAKQNGIGSATRRYIAIQEGHVYQFGGEESALVEVAAVTTKHSRVAAIHQQGEQRNTDKALAEAKARELLERKRQMLTRQLLRGHALFAGEVAEADEPGDPEAPQSDPNVKPTADAAPVSLTLTLPSQTSQRALIAFIQQGDEQAMFESFSAFERTFNVDRCIKLHRVDFVDGKAQCQIPPGRYNMLALPEGYEREWVEVEVKAKGPNTILVPVGRPQTYALLRIVPHDGANAWPARERFAAVSSEPTAWLLDPQFSQQHSLPIIFRSADSDQLQLDYPGIAKMAALGEGQLEDYAKRMPAKLVWQEPSNSKEQMTASQAFWQYGSGSFVPRLRFDNVKPGHVYRFDGEMHQMIEVELVTQKPAEFAARRQKAAERMAATFTLREAADMNKFLAASRLGACEKQLQAFVIKHPDDQQAQYALGATQTLLALEHVTQKLYRYGFRAETGSAFLPVLPLPSSLHNPEPQPVRYDDLRAILDELVKELAIAEASLAKVTDTTVQLRLDLAQASFDVDGDGTFDEGESLFEVLSRGSGGTLPTGFVVAFDYSDVLWLRGYCHTLSALCELLLIYNHQHLFDVAGAWLFAKPVPSKEPRSHDLQFVFPVRDKARGKAALLHLQSVTELSRLTWKAIQAETDDNREWLPGPQQKDGVFRVAITEEMVKAWHQVLDDADDLLAGKKLLPESGKRGLDFQQLLLDPPPLQAVNGVEDKWLDPYRREGELLDVERVEDIERTFNGNFFYFAAWFN